MKKITGFSFLLICALLLISPLNELLPTAKANRQAADHSGIWYDINEGTIRQAGERQIIPLASRTLAADLTALDRLLSRAPLEFTRAAELASVMLPLPLPDGTVGHFRIKESPIMESELAAKFPEIKTYVGHGIDDPTAMVRFDRTPAGFHAMILSSNGTVYIDPYSKEDIAHYMSYYKHDFRKELSEVFRKDTVLPNPNAESISAEDRAAFAPTVGEQLRTYRTAVATTGEYTAFHGGTVQGALNAVTTTLNRVSGIYEREFSIRLTLVNNNDQIIFTNANTDPFQNSDNDINLNQNVIDSRIGSANYDVGHVFTTSSGGVAALASVCDDSDKAEGLTGLENPTGDPFDVDYVAHEFGHQFGANHTQNNRCQRNRLTAYEPGSASTIMGYAGVCAPNLQNNSDDYFHGISFDEIMANVTSGIGSSCGTATATGNTPPSAEAGASYNIPAQTPFMLTGSASDSDNGASLTYGWEQFDLGSAWNGNSLPNTDNGNRPIFRSYDPVSSPIRIFPKLETILSGELFNDGEYLPTTTRTLTFRLTVRDNQSGGGGVSKDQTTLNVTNNAGPFQITAPNNAVTWSGGSQQTVRWNVANTTAAPVSCSSVNILLSTNGGTSFAHSLASGTANDGSQTITVPNDATSSARIKVECAGNIFFDISNANFTITGGGPTSTPTATPTVSTQATATPTATATPVSSGAILRTYDYTVAPNNSFIMTVEGANMAPPGLAAANVTLLYDHNVIQPTTCTVDSALTGICNTNLNGQIQFNGLSTSGLQGQFDIITVVFQAVGQENESSPLDLSTTVFTDLDGNDISVTVQDGSATIGQAIGDVSCDNLVNVVDALYILQYDVGSRTAAKNCPLASDTLLLDNCDVSNDNSCNSVDALFILQCDVDISNTFCPARIPTPSNTNNQQTGTRGGATVEVGTHTVSPSSTVNLPIRAKLGNAQLGAATVQVRFNPTIVQVAACQVTNSLVGQCHIDNQTGLISFNALSISGVTGTITLADITWQASSEGSSTLDVRIQTFADATGQTITASDVDGQINVTSSNTLFLPMIVK